ncbi:MAG: hypothetical protein D6769_02095 [Methanobacteriota archaeon]|nr:MAG: hypothetical protein D6769_02095 [Euryarchaeota archaeon]
MLWTSLRKNRKGAHITALLYSTALTRKTTFSSHMRDRMEWIVKKELPDYEFSPNLRSTSTTTLIFGKCDFDKKTIELNKHLYNERFNYWMLYLDIVFHEIAHGKAGNRAGHGRKWNGIYNRLLREYNVDMEQAKEEKESFYYKVIVPLQQKKAKTTMSCPSCKRLFYFQRNVRSTYMCSHCNKELTRLH